METDSPATMLIQEIVTTNTQSSVSFLAIPQIYRDLVVVARGRGTHAATVVDLLVQFNYDSSATYLRQYLEATTTVVDGAGSVTNAGCNIGALPGASAAANYSGATRATIFNYRDTTFFKTYTSQAGTGQASGVLNAQIDSGMWLSKAPIDHIVVVPISDAFVDGSVVSLYGMY